jgi:hypothetical protein
MEFSQGPHVIATVMYLDLHLSMVDNFNVTSHFCWKRVYVNHTKSVSGCFEGGGGGDINLTPAVRTM